MGEVLYRWLTVKRQEIVPGAFLFFNPVSNRFKNRRAASPDSYSPIALTNHVSESQYIMPVSLVENTTLIIEYQEPDKQWQQLIKAGGRVLKRHGKNLIFFSKNH